MKRYKDSRKNAPYKWYFPEKRAYQAISKQEYETRRDSIKEIDV